VAALGILFAEPEMEKVVEGEFPEIFVPLLFSLSCYTGVSVCEPKPKMKSVQVIIVYVNGQRQSNVLGIFVNLLNSY
jgi:hypothetical protein